MQHSVNVCLNLNTSYKNVYVVSQWSLLYLLPCFLFRRQSVTSAPILHRAEIHWHKFKKEVHRLVPVAARESPLQLTKLGFANPFLKNRNYVFHCGMHVETPPVQMTDFQLPAEVVVA